LDSKFWHDVTTCIKAAYPLIKVLQLVDSDEKPAMGFIYEAMDQAKEKIQVNFGSVKKRYCLYILLIIYLLLSVDYNVYQLGHVMLTIIFLFLFCSYMPIWNIIDAR